MSPFDAFHLPGLRESDVARWHTRSVGARELRWPELKPGAVDRLAERLRAARTDALADRHVADVVEALDAAAARLGAGTAGLRHEADDLLPAVTGYSPAMVRLVIDRMLADWRAPALESLLRAELGDAHVLDGFRPDPGGTPRLLRALGPELVFNVFSGNVPGVAVTAMVRALLVKAAVLGKTGADDPVLPVLFARALDDVDPELGGCVAVTYWPGGSPALEHAACGAADTIVIYGGEEAVAGVAALVPPSRRLVIHGPRASLGLIGRAALGRDRLAESAGRAARAVAVFDQLGCVSPHLYYVERGGESQPETFADALADALERLNDELPPGPARPEDAARIQQLRGAAEMRALAGQDVRLLVGPGTSYTVIYDADPTFTPSCLHRTVWVKPLDDLEGATTLLSPFTGLLQSVALACDDRRRNSLAEGLARAGVARVTTLEDLPWPRPYGHHDGAGPLRELLRWIDLEG